MIKPKSRPSNPKVWFESLIGKVTRPTLIGCRGYYLDSMGKKGKNDRNLYDDSICILSVDCFISFNANTDPSAYRKGIASLKEGTWDYKIGIHGLSKPKHLRYKALVQAGPVIVERDGIGEDKGFFGINIHRGAYRSTSSLGCQTIYPDQWESFISTVEYQMKKNNMKTIQYILMEKQG